MRFGHHAIRPVNTEYGDFISQLPVAAVEADAQLEYTEQNSVAFHEPCIIGNSESQIGQFISCRSTESSVQCRRSLYSGVISVCLSCP